MSLAECTGSHGHLLALAAAVPAVHAGTHTRQHTALPRALGTAAAPTPRCPGLRVPVGTVPLTAHVAFGAVWFRASWLPVVSQLPASLPRVPLSPQHSQTYFGFPEVEEEKKNPSSFEVGAHPKAEEREADLPSAFTDCIYF